jgi:hypothetical protein
MASLVGAASMTAQQYMDLEILHELGHALGEDHPGTSDANGAKGYNTNIWENCFQ